MISRCAILLTLAILLVSYGRQARTATAASLLESSGAGGTLGLTFRDSPSSAYPSATLSRLVAEPMPNGPQNDNVKRVLLKGGYHEGRTGEQHLA